MQIQRIRSIDLLRGAIMVLMAIDHIRLYGGIPAGGPTADLYFTTAPFWTTQDDGVRWGLPLMHLVWFLDVAILYLLCKWYAKMKANKPNSWMKFI